MIAEAESYLEVVSNFNTDAEYYIHEAHIINRALNRKSRIYQARTLAMEIQPENVLS